MAVLLRSGALSEVYAPARTVGVCVRKLLWLLPILAVAAAALEWLHVAVFHWAVHAYLVASAAAVAINALYKANARRGSVRVPEVALHGIELAFGWPGAFVAQRALRHKTRKLSYQAVFWLIVFAHLAAWTWWLSR